MGAVILAGSPAKPTDTGHNETNLDDAESAEPSVGSRISVSRKNLSGEMSPPGMSQLPRGGARQVGRHTACSAWQSYAQTICANVHEGGQPGWLRSSHR